MINKKYTGPLHVLGIDPGKKTGIATYDVVNNIFVSWEMDFTHKECAHIEETISNIHKYLAVSCERFDITPMTHKNSYAPWSLEVIGWLKRECLRYDIPFILQPRSSGKNFSTDHRLKELDWYVKGKSHANDAARYVLLFLIQRGWWDQRLGMMED